MLFVLIREQSWNTWEFFVISSEVTESNFNYETLFFCQYVFLFSKKVFFSSSFHHDEYAVMTLFGGAQYAQVSVTIFLFCVCVPVCICVCGGDFNEGWVGLS